MDQILGRFNFYQTWSGETGSRQTRSRCGTQTASFLVLGFILLFIFLNECWSLLLKIVDSEPLFWVCLSGWALNILFIFGVVIWYIWYIIHHFMQSRVGWDARSGVTRSSSLVGLVICRALMINIILILNQRSEIEEWVARIIKWLIVTATLISACWPTWSVLKGTNR